MRVTLQPRSHSCTRPIALAVSGILLLALTGCSGDGTDRSLRAAQAAATAKEKALTEAQAAATAAGPSSARRARPTSSPSTATATSSTPRHHRR